MRMSPFIAAFAGLASNLAAETPPNIVVILADDLGWNDVGWHGSPVRTPRMDALVKAGVELDRFYVFSTCSPTRAAVMTGRNPARFGILGPLGLDPKKSLPLETVTLAEALKDAGYSTGHVGKWHLGPAFEFGPRRQGFDSAYGYLHGQIDQFKHVYKNLAKSWFRDEAFVDETGHATDLLADEAVRFVTANKDRPFFLYFCLSVPHYPLQEDERWVKPYEGVIEDKDRRLNAAAITHMDSAVGRLADALTELKIDRNTLVLFLSDNGGQKDWNATDYGGAHGPYKQLGDNRPLRGWKGDVYEGGIRVPAFAYWPGKLRPATVTATLSAVDVLPTLCGLVGAKVPPELDGTDMRPVFEGKPEPARVRPLWWHTGSQSALLEAGRKLVVNRKAGKAELFDLSNDPLEKKDLSSEEAERVKGMRERLEALTRVGR